jgi:hypothetical protein
MFHASVSLRMASLYLAHVSVDTRQSGNPSLETPSRSRSNFALLIKLAGSLTSPKLVNVFSLVSSRYNGHVIMKRAKPTIDLTSTQLKYLSLQMPS